MKFINHTNHKELSDAAIEAIKLLRWNSKMFNELDLKTYWKYGASNVSARLFAGPENVRLLTYRPWNPMTKAIAMTNGDGNIHFNVYKVSKTTLASKVGTILHEYAHLCGFKHGNNFKTKEKCLYSVPYYLSENVERWV